jgi:hypothetical protein
LHETAIPANLLTIKYSRSKFAVFLGKVQVQSPALMRFHLLTAPLYADYSGISLVSALFAGKSGHASSGSYPRL